MEQVQCHARWLHPRPLLRMVTAAILSCLLIILTLPISRISATVPETHWRVRASSLPIWKLPLLAPLRPLSVADLSPGSSDLETRSCHFPRRRSSAQHASIGSDSKCSTDSVMPIWSSTSVTTAHGTEAWPNCSACLGVSRMAMTQRASLSLFAQDCLNRKSATCAQTLPQCLSYWGSQSRRMTRYGSAPQGGSTTRASSLSSKGCSSFWLRNLQDDLSCATHEPTSRSCWSIVHWVSIRTSYLHVGPCWSKRDRKPSRTGSTVEVMDRCPLPALPRLLAQGTDVMMQPLVGKSLFFRTCSISAPFRVLCLSRRAASVPSPRMQVTLLHCFLCTCKHRMPL